MLKPVLFIINICIVHMQSQLTDPISVEQGQLQGISNLDADQFLGVPYGDCPQRFAPVNDAKPWSGVFQATTLAPGCYQDCKSFPSACPNSVHECCFTLDLYRPPKTTNTSNLPVMVHFHGGAFTSDSANVQLLNASHLVGLTRNIIVIACNYRLGAFGFWFNLNDPVITAPGNVALLDQQKCLQWIQKNVVNFGGNPSNVTIWGQSAGASSVGFQLQQQYLNRSQAQYFHQVMFQSWPTGIQPRTLNESKQYNDAFALLVGCIPPIDITQCLRNKNASDILRASNQVKFDVLTYPNKLITVGLPWQATLELNSFYLKYNNINFINQYASQIQIPIFWGTNVDEGVLFIYEAINGTIPITYELAQLIIGALWHPENVNKISNLYNITLLNMTTDYHLTIAQILGDYVFTCPVRNMSRALVTAGNKNIYSYIFDYILQANGTLYASSQWTPECYQYVCHKCEMPFVFHPLDVPTIIYNDNEQTFAQQIGNYWTNFGNTGNPNSPSSVPFPWNAFPTSTNISIHLKLGNFSNWQNYRGDPFCDYWDSLGYIF